MKAPDERQMGTPITADGFHVRSSIADDVWHADAEPGAYEWWYFDAISFDGRDALVIIFLTDFLFSPRYNRAVAEGRRNLREGGAPVLLRPTEFPAVAVCLYRDGRPVVRAIHEFTREEFAAQIDHPACRIGGNSFRLEQGAEKSSYLIRIDMPLRRGRRLEAEFEWTITDGDLSPKGETLPTADASSAGVHEWNVVAPRCHVSGRLATMGPGSDRRLTEYDFQGLGYHDHNRDRRPLARAVAEWQWGRAHFPAATAVFYRYRERGKQLPLTRLFIVERGELRAYDSRFSQDGTRRHHFGLRHPYALRFSAETAEERWPVTLEVEQRQIVDASFFYLRFMGQARLELNDGRTTSAPVITEHLAPRALEWRSLWWLINMRIGRNGRPAFLP